MEKKKEKGWIVICVSMHGVGGMSTETINIPESLETLTPEQIKDLIVDAVKEVK